MIQWMTVYFEGVVIRKTDIAMAFSPRSMVNESMGGEWTVLGCNICSFQVSHPESMGKVHSCDEPASVRDGQGAGCQGLLSANRQAFKLTRVTGHGGMVRGWSLTQ